MVTIIFPIHMSMMIPKQSRFKINDVKVLTSWRHNLKLNKECTICRCNLNEDSLSYQTKGLASYIIVGECGHSFHKECLESWIQEHKRCPICAEKWSYQS